MKGKKNHGFELTRLYQVNDSSFSWFKRTLYDIPIYYPSYLGKIKLKLLPVVMKVLIEKSSRGYRLSDIVLEGHPKKYWHPHIGGFYSGFNAICWGNVSHPSKGSLRDLLLENMYICIGFLADFMGQNMRMHPPREVLHVHTVPVRETRITSLKGRRVESFREDLWIRGEDESHESPTIRL